MVRSMALSIRMYAVCKASENFPSSKSNYETRNCYPRFSHPTISATAAKGKGSRLGLPFVTSAWFIINKGLW